MAIDESGKWWKGSAPSDLHEYLQAFTAESYEISEFRLARCDCGSEQFLLEVEDNEGVARRTCAGCKKPHFICDSEENWTEGLQTRKYKCVTCRSTVANVGVGFSLYDDRLAVRWVYIGCRCTKCGVLGCMVDWKVGYEPSLQLLDQA